MTALGIERYLLDDEVALWQAQVRDRLVGSDVELPLYGSDEWRGAPDPVRLASALRAAEAWRRDGLTLAQRLRDELAAARWVQDCQDAEEWAQAAGRVSRIACGPSHDELRQRRAVVTRPTVPGVAA